MEGEQGYDESSKNIAFARAQEWGDRIPTGVFYRKQMVTFEEQQHIPLKDTLVKQAIEPGKVSGLLDGLL